MKDYWIYLLIISLSTYLIRALPFVAVQNKIKNQFVRSFLYYIPYTVLVVMTLPAALFATGNIYAAGVGLLVAIILAFFRQSLTVVAVSSCAVVLISEYVISNFVF